MKNLQSNINLCKRLLANKTLFSSTRWMTIHSRMATVDGCDIHYDTAGKGKNVLLLMPGAIGSARTDFKPQIKHLNRDLFTIVAWDPPGFGRSVKPARTWPVDWYERDADVAAGLMKALAIPKYNVLGWGDGGFTGKILASRNPESVEKLLVWSTHSYLSLERVRELVLMLDLENWSERTKERYLNEYSELHFKKLWKEYLRAFEKYFAQGKQEEYKAMLNRIQCPTLIVRGERDRFVLEEEAQLMQYYMKDARYTEMPEAKHNLHLRYGKGFNAIIERFIVRPIP